MTTSTPPDGLERAEMLRRGDRADADSASFFADFALLAAQLCRAPAALFSRTDDDRTADHQSLLAHIHLPSDDAPHALDFCRQALRGGEAHDNGRLDGDVFVVRDASTDERFARNPLVTGAARLRFFAIAPLVAPTGRVSGALCVCDAMPR
jgi:GAF domain-containing protein